MELKLIQSFQVDHTKLKRGVYISRKDGEITTYDIRMKIPNAGDYLENGALHTIEHLFATYVRSSSASENIIYFGPMGCRTGFYLITHNLEHAAVIELIRETFEFISKFEGEIPGSEEKECGNFKDHNLNGAKLEAQTFIKVLEKVNESTLSY